jgi:E3 SUMO-protein ligase PIAS1
LESTPDTVEDVIVEANGEWHTSDDRHASDAWKKTHKHGLPAVSPTPRPKHQATSNSPSGYIRDASTQERSQRPEDVVVLDSEEEDEGEVKRELSPSRAERIPMSGLSGTQVIDLTVESDDESAFNRSLGKRKAESDSVLASEDVWKKSRIGEAPNATNLNDNVNISTSGVLVSRNNHGARRYAVNGVPLPHRPPSHSTQFTPVTHGSPFTPSYYTQRSQAAAPSPGSFGPQVSPHRPGYYSQFGNIA